MINEQSTLITIPELCEQLMIGRNAAYQLLRSGELKCFRLNRIWKIPQQSVTEYLQRKSNLIFSSIL